MYYLTCFVLVVSTTSPGVAGINYADILDLVSTIKSHLQREKILVQTTKAAGAQA